MLPLDVAEVIAIAQNEPGLSDPLHRRLDTCNPRWPSHYVGVAEIVPGKGRFSLVEEGDRGLRAIIVPAVDDEGELIDAVAFDPLKFRHWTYTGAAWCLGQECLFDLSRLDGAVPLFRNFWEALAADFEGCLPLDDRRTLFEFYTRGIGRVAASSKQAGDEFLRRLSAQRLAPEILIPAEAA